MLLISCVSVLRMAVKSQFACYGACGRLLCICKVSAVHWLRLLQHEIGTNVCECVSSGVSTFDACWLCCSQELVIAACCTGLAGALHRLRCSAAKELLCCSSRTQLSFILAPAAFATQGRDSPVWCWWRVADCAQKCWLTRAACMWHARQRAAAVSLMSSLVLRRVRLMACMPREGLLGYCGTVQKGTAVACRPHVNSDNICSSSSSSSSSVCASTTACATHVDGGVQRTLLPLQSGHILLIGK
jgi:hypothetical protein